MPKPKKASKGRVFDDVRRAKILQAMREILNTETERKIYSDLQLLDEIKAKGVYATKTVVCDLRRENYSSPEVRKAEIWERIHGGKN